jgi:hypothetical protein
LRRISASSSRSSGTRILASIATLTVTFAEKDENTVQTFHQTPFLSVAIRDSHIGGWNSLFNKQQIYVENIAVAERNGFRA